MRTAYDWQDDWLTVSAEGITGVILLPSKLLSVAVKRINSHRRRSVFWRLLFLFRIYFLNNLRGQITEPRRRLQSGRSQDKQRGSIVRVRFSSRWKKRTFFFVMRCCIVIKPLQYIYWPRDKLLQLFPSAVFAFLPLRALYLSCSLSSAHTHLWSTEIPVSDLDGLVHSRAEHVCENSPAIFFFLIAQSP